MKEQTERHHCKSVKTLLLLKGAGAPPSHQKNLPLTLFSQIQ